MKDYDLLSMSIVLRAQLTGSMRVVYAFDVSNGRDE